MYAVMVRTVGGDRLTELCRVTTKEGAEDAASVVRKKKTSGRRHLPIYEHVEVKEVA